MAEDTETVKELRARIAELENARTVRPDRAAFMQWLLKERNLDSQDFDGLTENGINALQTEYANIQAVEARAAALQKPKRNVVLPPEAADWSDGQKLRYANLIEHGADDSEFTRHGVVPPKRD